MVVVDAVTSFDKRREHAASARVAGFKKALMLMVQNKPDLREQIVSLVRQEQERRIK